MATVWEQRKSPTTIPSSPTTASANAPLPFDDTVEFYDRTAIYVQAEGLPVDGSGNIPTVFDMASGALKAPFIARNTAAVGKLTKANGHYYIDFSADDVNQAGYGFDPAILNDAPDGLVCASFKTVTSASPSPNIFAVSQLGASTPIIAMQANSTNTRWLAKRENSQSEVLVAKNNVVANTMAYWGGVSTSRDAVSTVLLNASTPTPTQSATPLPGVAGSRFNFSEANGQGGTLFSAYYGASGEQVARWRGLCNLLCLGPWDWNVNDTTSDTYLTFRDLTLGQRAKLIAATGS